MRKPKYSDEQIITAGQQLEDAGKSTTAFAIIQALGGGNAARVSTIWTAHKESQHISDEEVKFEDLAPVIKETAESFKSSIDEFAIVCSQQAKLLAESRVSDLLNTLDKTKAESLVEMEDASSILDELREKNTLLQAKNSQLESEIQVLITEKSEISGRYKNEQEIRKSRDLELEKLYEKLKSVCTERDQAQGHAVFLQNEFDKLKITVKYPPP